MVNLLFLIDAGANNFILKGFPFHCLFPFFSVVKIIYFLSIVVGIEPPPSDPNSYNPKIFKILKPSTLQAEL